MIDPVVSVFTRKLLRSIMTVIAWYTVTRGAVIETKFGGLPVIKYQTFKTKN